MNKCRNKFNATVCVVIILFSCSTFIREEQVNDVLQLEGKVATLKKTFERDGYRLESGSNVRLHLIVKDDNIRVYVYPAEMDFLKSKRYLVLHLFDDDFKDNKFDKKFFMEKLQEVVLIK